MGKVPRTEADEVSDGPQSFFRAAGDVSPYNTYRMGGSHPPVPLVRRTVNDRPYGLILLTDRFIHDKLNVSL